jgi:hypothetical protein
MGSFTAGQIDEAKLGSKLLHPTSALLGKNSLMSSHVTALLKMFKVNSRNLKKEVSHHQIESRDMPIFWDMMRAGTSCSGPKFLARTSRFTTSSLPDTL